VTVCSCFAPLLSVKSSTAPVSELPGVTVEVLKSKVPESTAEPFV
jgi:hypothetical protein